MKEIEKLKNRGILILEFMGSTLNNKSYFQPSIDMLNQEALNGNLRGIKLMIRDINSWVKGISQDDLLILDKMLINQFGEGILGETFLIKKVNSILKAGKIKNLNEYKLVHYITQDITENDPLFNYLENLEGLLADFDHINRR